eukprot:TRINITY_DN23910_c0_g1_i1.p1 TRINITY_DN23910_c0_g1~~TRINITY_DN23910_c0_g1_i1.p1  ORF type:complete len:104 (-),score=8.19 TRINITY_DN23910_c0_g1_i1:2-313(-)
MATWAYSHRDESIVKEDTATYSSSADDESLAMEDGVSDPTPPKSRSMRTPREATRLVFKLTDIFMDPLEEHPTLLTEDSYHDFSSMDEESASSEDNKTQVQDR